jgi:predicted secreted protein
VSADEGGAPAGRRAPKGRRWLRVVLWTVVVAVVVVVLFTTVFPWVESMTQDPTLGAAPSAQVLRTPT